MRAQSWWYGVVLLAFGAEAENARCEQPASPEHSQVSSCPTVLPVADGERSVVVPTIAPQIEAPHVASRLPPTEHDAAKSLLQEKLAQRDRLQREIAALRVATKTPEQILVKVKMLEVNLTKMRKLGIDFSTFLNPNDTAFKAPFSGTRVDAPHGSPGTFEFGILEDGKTIGGFVDALQQRNLARVLAEPTIVTTSGHAASFCVGGEFPVPVENRNSVEFRKYGSQVDLTAELLGHNEIRLHIRPRVSELDASRAVKVGEIEVPALKVREVDTAVEMELGQSAVISGLVQERPESVVTASGVRTEVQEIALVIVVTPEIVR